MRGFFSSTIVWLDGSGGNFAQDALSEQDMKDLIFLRENPDTTALFSYSLQFLKKLAPTPEMACMVYQVLFRCNCNMVLVEQELALTNPRAWYLAKAYLEWKRDIPPATVSKVCFFWDMLHATRRSIPKVLPVQFKFMFTYADSWVDILEVYNMWRTTSTNLKELMFLLILKYASKRRVQKNDRTFVVTQRMDPTLFRSSNAKRPRPTKDKLVKTLKILHQKFHECVQDIGNTRAFAVSLKRMRTVSNEDEDDEEPQLLGLVSFRFFKGYFLSKWCKDVKQHLYATMTAKLLWVHLLYIADNPQACTQNNCRILFTEK